MTFNPRSFEIIIFTCGFKNIIVCKKNQLRQQKTMKIYGFLMFLKQLKENFNNSSEFR